MELRLVAVVGSTLALLLAGCGGERHLAVSADGKAVIRLHYNLLAPWLWLGAAVMALGGALSLADRRVRVSAPHRRAAAQAAAA